MTIKLITGVMLIFALMVVLFSGNSSDPLFLFISNNAVTNTGRIIVAALLVGLALRGYIKNPRLRQALGLIGFGVVLMAGYALFSPVMEGLLYTYLKPLDLLLAIEMGIVASLLSFSPVADAPATEMPANQSATSPVLAAAK